MRVTSTAPYFVDDRLYCPKSLMDDCKLLKLNVSLGLEWEVDDDRHDDTGVPRGEGGEFKQVQADGAHRGSRRQTTTGASKGGPPTASSTRRNGEFTCDALDASQVGEDPEARASTSVSSATKDQERTPWVLDICLVRHSSPIPAAVRDRVSLFV